MTGAAYAAEPESTTSSAPAPIENDMCFTCHDDVQASKTLPDGGTLSLYVAKEPFEKSLHAPLGCVGCHTDIKEVPHAEKLKPVDCGACHSDELDVYKNSLHGQAMAKGDALAPSCADCHGKHDIKPASEPDSATNAIHIPDTCGGCHAEDAPVAKSRNIKQHDILQNYEEGVHGEGLRKKGLKVTATCVSCHSAHDILPDTDPKSSISRANIVSTCTKCHALIEEVHRKIINQELWEKDPHVIPVCIDCHQPHKARKVFYDEGVSDRDCMMCHSKPVRGAKGELPAVDIEAMAGARHGGTRCAQCHTGADASLQRPCEKVTAEVDCSICHADQVTQHTNSIHGVKASEGDKDAPRCLDCHAGHVTLGKADPASPTFPSNVPALCARCHNEGAVIDVRGTSSQKQVVADYSTSVHGKGLLESGLVVTATCTSCHTAHAIRPSRDPQSSVSKAKIADTCGACHSGVEQVFMASVHSPLVSKPENGHELPVCSSCHSSHRIKRTDANEFMQSVMGSCGECHADVSATYFQTTHGKAALLGSPKAAKCYDCHGAHDILPPSDPASHLSRANIVDTCAKCHAGSHRRFAGYLTHATHHDPKKYPALFIAFWGMTGLLVGTFAFFALHTLLWFPRSLREKMKQRGGEATKSHVMFRRFDPIVRQMHFVLILTFFGLALTGMALKFSYMDWAVALANAMGGFGATAIIHRTCAVIMIVDFIIHIGVIIHRKREFGMSWKSLLLGPSSLVPNLNDVREFIQTVKWFLRLGPRPQYGEWTYWEKFDYFAVFWGVAIIGSTGFMLWFPEFFTHFLPGWMINVATIIHSDEALLAVGFIFTIHFFNTHFRPEKFPMDMAMFTGMVPEEELKHERPRYYEQLVQEGQLEKRLTTIPAPKEFRFWAAIFGTAALVVGFTLVFLILWSMIFGYK